MNQESRGAARPAQPTTGSVRAARQRAEAGVPFDNSRSQNSFQNPRPLGPPDPSAISRPAPMPQWPLINPNEGNMGRQNNSFADERTENRGAPPQRPPRPSYVPSLLDSSRIQEHTPAFQYQPQQPQHDHSIPVLKQAQQPQQPKYWEPTSPQDPYAQVGRLSISSRPSTSSSVGTIPDFPVPILPNASQAPSQQQQQQYQQQAQPRRSANLGPPPSSRRGASSYYSQSSYVAPIPEEYPEVPRNRNTRGQYAEENASARNWSDGPSTYYLSGVTNDEDDDDDVDIRDSRSTEPDEQTNLVRKASLGKQYKPSLTTVRSGSSSSSGDSNKQGNDKLGRPNFVGRAAVSAGAQAGAFAAGLGNSKTNQNAESVNNVPRTTFLERPSDESSSRSLGRPSDEGARSTDPNDSTRSPPVDPRVEQILGGLQKGGAIDSATAVPLISSHSGSSSPIGKKPLRLDIDAVKKAEQRGSLTSLSDLIRRATKVASNLDKGRTASRLGMLDMFNSSNPNLLDKHDPNRPRNSISDMLSSFPPPGMHTPTPSGDRPISRWPSPFANNSNNHLASTMNMETKTGEPRQKQIRRCCGLPLWAFMLILIVVFLLVAAAVVIPIVLIVIPRQSSASNAAAAIDLSNCPLTSPCANGGTSVVSANSCRCVCANGFTGSGCQNSADDACTTSNLNPFKNATLGNNIQRILSSSQSNFTVPLNATALLAAFSATNLSCSDENNLITFSGQSRRRSLPVPVLHADQPPHPMVTIVPRAPQEESGSDPITSNGIIFANPETATTQTSSAAPSSPTVASSSTEPEQKDLDFARTAVLYILQEEQLDAAVNAQRKLQTALSRRPFVAEPVNISSSIAVDFLTRKITIRSSSVGSRKGG